jgi:hypothetical protein
MIWIRTEALEDNRSKLLSLEELAQRFLEAPSDRAIREWTPQIGSTMIYSKAVQRLQRHLYESVI